jgi:hypothetical protein
LSANSTMAQLSFITLFMLLRFVSLVSSKQCYFLDGTDASANGKICNPNSDVSSCCATTDSCLTSGLCLSPNGLIYQFGCTDQEGKSCPVVCPTRKYSISQVFLELLPPSRNDVWHEPITHAGDFATSTSIPDLSVNYPPIVDFWH